MATPAEPIVTQDYVSRVVTSIPYPATEFLTGADLWIDENRVNIPKLKEHFLNEGRLAKEDVLKILGKADAILRAEPNLLKVQSPVTICGDVHGQYYDLMKLFEVGGEPEETNYLFLGDYVDRGYFSCEVVLYLYAHKINYPESVFLLRGNHECRHLTEYFTFKEECNVKYDSEIYDRICDTFDSLPLAAIMNEQFFCVHGGISPDLIFLDDIRSLNRFQEPPQRGLMCDLLWSDPIEDYNEDDGMGFIANEARGCSYSFGFKAVTTFLDKNKLLCVIRAHEAQDLGYKMYKQHPKTKFPTLITLFSAPNYLDAYGNKGAVMRYDKAVMNIRQFQHVDHPYWLPNFMDVITWSLPFVAEKVSETLLAILKLCDSEEIIEKQREAKRAELKRKILLLGRLSKMYGDIQVERLAAVKLRGLTPDGGTAKAPGLLKAVTDSAVIGNFTTAKLFDMENEKRPPALTTLKSARKRGLGKTV